MGENKPGGNRPKGGSPPQRPAQSSGRNSQNGGTQGQGAARQRQSSQGGNNRTKIGSSGSGNAGGRGNTASGVQKNGSAPKRPNTGASKNGYASRQGRPAQGGSKKPAATRNTSKASQDRRPAGYRRYKSRSKLYSALFYAAVFFIVIFIVIALSVTVLFNVKVIDISRDEEVSYTDAQILEACGLSVGQNLFMVDSTEVREKLTMTLPYIEECNVKKLLPSTLRLELKTAKALGKLTTTDGYHIIISTGGRVLQTADGEASGGIPTLNGIEAEMSVIGKQIKTDNLGKLKTAEQLVLGMREYGLGLDSVTFARDGTVSAVYDGRINLIFGLPMNLTDKMKLAGVMINEGKITRNEKGDLNLSVDGKAVFTADYLKKDKNDEEGG